MGMDNISIIASIIFYKTESAAQRLQEITQGAGVDLIIDMDFATTSLLIPAGALKPLDIVEAGAADDPATLAAACAGLALL